jgi:5-methyltetrahydropteroyltriglutamate--homocysteine methyltransferase
MSVISSCLGYPRIGDARELKRALESFWAKEISAEELQAAAAALRRRHWQAMKAAGIRQLPSNDFSLYDHVLDMMDTVGAVPPRFRAIRDPLTRYFAMARGYQDQTTGLDLTALEMTKWFDTNYHYLVPELAVGQSFELDVSRILRHVEEARSLGIETRPVLLGPVTFLLLSKLPLDAAPDASPLDSLDALLCVYEELLRVLKHNRVQWVQLDEPCLVLDPTETTERAYRRALQRLGSVHGRPRLLLASYFGAPAESLVRQAVSSGFDAIHVDLAGFPERLDAVLGAVGRGMSVSLGVVDGRNVWRTDLDAAHALVRRAVRVLGPERVLVGPSCSLLHVPVDLDAETGLDPELKSWLAFATQKLRELQALAEAAEIETPTGEDFRVARAALASRRASGRTRDLGVRRRVAQVTESMLRRNSPHIERARLQSQRLALPLLPTTTIGSFPQTGEVRKARADWRAGRIGADEYRAFLLTEIRRCIEKQEELGLDMVVHGEFERNDMVEFFGEQLQGFAFTERGWVQSYGSRCVKPPILFGDVSRPRAMTVDWWRHAQSLTGRPVKGMLTGPVTILQWSFVRNDQDRSETALQIALALRDEVADLEAAGAAAIQVDEPALREGLPLQRREWTDYLRWAVDAFRLTTSLVHDQTQIHTHMCYAEFGDILQPIVEMDADVLSIETSRSQMQLLGDFARFRYPSQLGPGVYDIHSPRVPTVAEITELLIKASQVIPVERLWVNPDCGLKTRGWPEVMAALRNMVEAARRVRARISEAQGQPVPAPGPLKVGCNRRLAWPGPDQSR